MIRKCYSLTTFQVLKKRNKHYVCSNVLSSTRTVSFGADRVLQDAKACDSELSSGRLRGALHGVPVSIKDNLLTEQMITTGGSFAF